MNGPQFFRLDQDPRGTGLRCDEEGLFLSGVPLLERCSRGKFQPRSQHALRKALGTAFDSEADLSSRIRSVGVVANSLNNGNIAHAMMAAVLMRIPEQGKRIRVADADGILAKANFNSDEPRDKHGRWSSSGGGPDSTLAFAYPEPLIEELIEPLIARPVRPFPDIIDIVPPVTNWKNPGSIPRNPYPDRAECVEEWDRAKEFCERLWRERKLGTDKYRGFGRTMRQCMMGQVSEDCGGNPVSGMLIA